LRMRVRGQGAKQQRGENRKVPHSRSIGWGGRAPKRIREGRITKVPSACDNERMADVWDSLASLRVNCGHCRQLGFAAFVCGENATHVFIKGKYDRPRYSHSQ
jgi:hypothetical protein